MNGERIKSIIITFHPSLFTKKTWNEAMERYGDSLPSKEQAEVMANQYKAINKAIIAFGGDKHPSWWYWTKTEKDSSLTPSYSSVAPWRDAATWEI